MPHQAPPSPLAWGILQISKVLYDEEIGVKMYRMPRWWKHRKKVSTRNYNNLLRLINVLALSQNTSDLLSLQRPQSYPTVLYLKLQLKDPSDLSTEAQLRSHTPTAQVSSIKRDCFKYL